MTEPNQSRAATVRCAFCEELNQIDVGRAAERPGCAECARPMLLDRPLKVAEADFDRTVLEAQVPVLVDFYADWCGPCKMIAPFIDDLAQEHTGDMLVAKVDTDRAQEVAMRYGIRSIPTLILFDGGEETDRSLGFEPERVREFIARAVS